MDDILAAAAKLQEQYKHLQERNSRLTAALEDKSKKLQALHQSVEQRGKDLAALELQAHHKFAEELRLRAGSRVKLDVGGVHFTTSLTTLMTEPDSMLAAMFSGRHELEKDDDGRVFIDRDGELFNYVLQYLREGELDLFQLPSGVKQRLKREAAFYCLPKLEEKLGSDAEAKALPGSVHLAVLVYYGPGVEPRFITQGDPLHLADRFPKLQGSYPDQSVVRELWRTRVLPVILESYHNYHLISVEKESPYYWEVHLNRIVP
ncbi:K+ channel tetramerization subfamily protein [Acanthamoeba castellanii str. Neff]|uniref:K+ channel tetramerisation subfamily protein n=1 Tax=Acanthamoeba castellanii (strain ATCC 30010 / Neff) TaxID=1257118 RepID=M0QSN0_ACACF|nr:K+ channel tetramerization subfamily protein [Acanthamoeba castellanii str. Neff]ELR13903.1 K+ channel tetramerisation subfamily protein [Acanthamoeba castellanii str. Neff]